MNNCIFTIWLFFLTTCIWVLLPVFKLFLSISLLKCLSMSKSGMVCSEMCLQCKLWLLIILCQLIFKSQNIGFGRLFYWCIPGNNVVWTNTFFWAEIILWIVFYNARLCLCYTFLPLYCFKSGCLIADWAL